MKKYTQEELREIIEKHRMWLREVKGGERANLSYADLSSADLSYADLSYADLSGAQTGGAMLQEARLDNTIWIDGRVCAVRSLGACR